MLWHVAASRVRRVGAVELFAASATTAGRIRWATGLTVALIAISVVMVPASWTQEASLVPVRTARTNSVAAVATRVPRALVSTVSEPTVADCVSGAPTIGVVASVIDGRSFVLADGREVRLAAIETPSLATPDEAREEGVAARLELESLLRDRAVTVQPISAGDRYGRVVGFVFTAMPDGLVQHEMLAQGYALLSPIAIPLGCRNILRAAEHSARNAKLGLWGDPYYQVRRADDAADLLAERGRFVLVGGRVQSVRESGGIVYVNFGRRWVEDFTVTILKRNERLFTGAGLHPSGFSGRWIEVRGFVEQHGGPAIEASRPEQIELVE